MITICKYLAGSHLYNLATEHSDIDYRSIFLNESIGEIIGLNRHDHSVSKSETEDNVAYELRRFLSLLKKTNTQVVEALWVKKYEISHDCFKQLIENRLKLMDSELFYRSLKGYLFSEYRLAIGQRMGRLGAQRAENIEKFDFSPKNFCMLLRLCQTGIIFFRHGVYPLDLSEFDKDFHKLIFEIKTKPQEFKLEVLTKWAIEKEKELDLAYQNTKIVTRFDEKLANSIIFDAYMPILEFCG